MSASQTRGSYIDGVPKLMTPGSMAHTLLKSNAGRALGNALDQTGCRALVDSVIIGVGGSSLIRRCRDLQRAGFHDAADR